MDDVWAWDFRPVRWNLEHCTINPAVFICEECGHEYTSRGSDAENWDRFCSFACEADTLDRELIARSTYLDPDMERIQRYLRGDDDAK